MAELKVQCDCGQKFKFDVEPVGGRMPFTVNCPLCGVDATEKANELLSRSNAVSAAPAPVVAGAPSVPTGAPKLRISAQAHAPAAAPEAAADASPQAGSPPAMPRGRPGALPVAKDGKPKRKPNFTLGFVGGILGAFLGAAIYYVIFRYTGFRLGLMALAVGFLGGLGARVLGGEQEGNELGYITAALVIAGILGAQYFVARAWWHEGEKAGLKSGYEAMVTESKRVVAAVPTGSDQEIRAFLAKEDSDDEKVDPSTVSAEDVKEFRDNTLPEMRNLAEGKTTKEDFEKQHAAEIAKAQQAEQDDEGTFKAVFILLLMNRVGLVSMCAAAALAFKMSS